ncbi:MAG TPA: type VI secretion system baseplate subunit TssK [Noviherbaspirillum sp.]
MAHLHRILWGEGMFLRPQHFQQQAQFDEGLAARIITQSAAFPWGVRKLVLDSDALRAGQVRVDTLDLVFQDGFHVDAPGGCPLPSSRELASIPTTVSSLLIYACIPELNAFGGNVHSLSEPAPRPPRYVSGTVPLTDLYTGALEAEITVLHANVRLLLEHENRDGHQSLPIARLSRSATGHWEIDEKYIPPLASIEGSPALVTLTRRLLDILLAKSQALAATHRERRKSIAEQSSADITSFWLLHTVNRTFPPLNHYLRTSPRPEALYSLLAQLCGELMTFSTTATLADIPAYTHLDLATVFERLDTMIRELLDTVISSRYMIIPLANSRPSFFIGKLDSERLIENADFYLSVSGDMPIADMLESVPSRLKVGAPDDVEKILHSALPGVPLRHALQTPAAVPVRVGNHYFALEKQGQIFERMLKARSICIYVPQALLGLKLELVAVVN